MYDVAIIGGGPAGLAGALSLARSCKNVLLVDGGTPRNERAQYIGNFITQDRVTPMAFRAAAHDDLRAYRTVEIHSDAVAMRIDHADNALVLHVDSQIHVARSVLLATGLVDEPVPLYGAQALWGRSLFQCPYCHAFEHRGKTFGFLSPSAQDCEWAILLRAWTRSVIVFTNGAYTLSEEQRSRLTDACIHIEERQILGLEHDGECLETVQFMDGSVSWVKALFCRTEKRQVPVVESLGLEMTTEGYVRINENFQTSMKDVYAAGDLAAHYHGALAAAAAGNHAGHCINHDLTLDLVKRCLL